MSTNPVDSSCSPSKRKVHFVVLRNAYIEDPCSQQVDISKSYYTKSEYAEIANQNKANLEMLQKRNCLHTTEYCIRGLEAKSPRGGRRKAANRRRARKAVIDESFRQKLEGVHDPEILAEIYKGFSTQCARIAHSVARLDAQIARDISCEKQDLFLVDKDDASNLAVPTEATEFSSEVFSGNITFVDFPLVGVSGKPNGTTHIASTPLRTDLFARVFGKHRR
jgi:hypothetical protein